MAQGKTDDDEKVRKQMMVEESCTQQCMYQLSNTNVIPYQLHKLLKITWSCWKCTGCINMSFKWLSPRLCTDLFLSFSQFVDQSMKLNANTQSIIVHSFQFKWFEPEVYAVNGSKSVICKIIPILWLHVYWIFLCFKKRLKPIASGLWESFLLNCNFGSF